MGFINNVNVDVRGASHIAPCTYKTVVLKKNITKENLNVLTQAMLDEYNINTKFVIKWDYVLKTDIIIPNNCILEFDGGSISGEYIITGQDTNIQADIVKIFDSTITLKGRWRVKEYYPEWFGAITDNSAIDCSIAINKTAEVAGNSFGGIIRLSQGYYYFSTSIILNHKVSIKGAGIGVTILKQADGVDCSGIIIDQKYAIIKLSDFSIKGNKTYNSTPGNDIGINILNRGLAPGQIDGEQQQYAYTEYNDDNYQYYPGMKRILIDNIVEAGFSDGAYVGSGNFGVFITNSYFGNNANYGLIVKTTDSTINNCYINNNGNTGLYLSGGNNKISNIKSIFNCEKLINVKDGAAIAVLGSRNSLVSCETQDNMCKGFDITGTFNIFVNCYSNSDCYILNYNKGYQADYNSYGFYIHESSGKEGNNTFKNCTVSMYNYSIYGAIYSLPIKTLYDYPKLYEGIKVEFANYQGLFREIDYKPDLSQPSHAIQNPIIEVIDNINYLHFTNNENISETLSVPNELYVYCSFRVDTDNQNVSQTLFKIADIEVILTKSNNGYFVLQAFQSGVTSCNCHEINLDDGSIRTLLLHIYGNTVTLYSIGTHKNSNVPLYIFDTKTNFNFQKKKLDIIRLKNYINKFVVTQRPIDRTYLIPGSNLSNFRSDALVYLSADNI